MTSVRPDPSRALGLDRTNLAERTRAILHHGGARNPDVLLVESALGDVVVKDFAPREGWVRRWLGPWLLEREARAYRSLDGLEAIPRLLGRIDREALIFEYRPGTLLSRSLAGQLPSDFLPALQQAIDAMHGRGVVHLDLRHRSNILADPEGRPVVLDFASALHFDREAWWGRLGLALFGWLDRRALRKWQVRLV